MYLESYVTNKDLADSSRYILLCKYPRENWISQSITTVTH